MSVESQWNGEKLEWIFTNDESVVIIGHDEFITWCNGHFDLIYQRPNDNIIRQRHVDAFEKHLKESRNA